jgi:type II restriction enzyme
MDLNLLNFLIGKKDFNREFDELLKIHPELVRTIPSLVVRDGSGTRRFSIVQDLVNLASPEKVFDFSKAADTPELRSAAIEFVNQTGLIRVFQDDGIKNLVDYVMGVEAGLDSNARKNRSGKSMEAVVGTYLEAFCAKHGYKFLSQVKATKIKEKLGFDVTSDKAKRIYDFAITDGKKLAIMEVNFYGGGGSKLKSTAGEYKGLHSSLTEQGYDFVWVTDGFGWLSTLPPLHDAFTTIDYIWNLRQLGDGYLEDLFK